MRTSIAALGLALAVSALAAPASWASGKTLSVDERADAQRALEQVYWTHRLWPKDNPEPKPALAAVVPDEALKIRAEDSLRKSKALETLWGRPITAAMLQAEMDRMARETRDPNTLRELFSALGDDPRRIAETLAREKLADRLLRGWYAFDERFHGDRRRAAEAALSGASASASLRELGGEYQEATWTLDDGSEALPGADTIRLPRAEWDTHLRELARHFDSKALRPPVGRRTALTETPEAFVVRSVVAQTGTSVTVAIARWNKESFDAWWSRERAAVAAEAPEVRFEFRLPSIAPDPCVDDTWQIEANVGVPDERAGHSAVWTGSEMIVWGGESTWSELATGSKYDPATDTWSGITTAGAPAARTGHTVVWTGTEMVVWGGRRATKLGSGGRYNPLSDQWTATSNLGAPTQRGEHTAVWTGSAMIVWGGVDNSGVALKTGGSYNPANNSWTATNSATAPPARSLHTAVWTGARMVVWGGFDASTLTHFGTGSRYDPAANSWSAVTLTSAPAGRSRHTAVWTGDRMIVWGGDTSGGLTATLGSYDPAGNSWGAANAEGNFAPSGRKDHSAVWTGTEMIVWGGFDGAYTNDGSAYDPSTETWTAIANAAAPSARTGHTAVWTGTEMIVWGGSVTTVQGTTFHETGGRYDPAADSWVPTSAAGAPTPRAGHSAVWTGTAMIVWGGDSAIEGFVNSGGAYDPAINSWTPTSTGPGVPTPRIGHRAVWTGSRMIVWGGSDGSGSVGTGSRYDPVTAQWTPTSSSNAPSPRAGHSVVWTGSRMIVWGGYNGAPNNVIVGGSRYDPVTDTWSTVAFAGGPTGRRDHTAVWTGSEMIVWGGYDGTYPLTGGRYNPATNVWTATSTGFGVPSGRESHTAVWSGSRMIVWGGGDIVGSRYEPASNSWIGTSTANVPSGRYEHTAVWTGARMIVWGGRDLQFNATDTGGRYDPPTDTDNWVETALNGAPVARYRHTAVWTGSRMLVWGGVPSFDVDRSVGIYCAAVPCDGVPSGCDDGNACTVDSCDTFEQQCAHSAISCDDFNPCTSDSCNPEAGCVHLTGTDLDIDGVADVCDNCAAAANPAQHDLDADGEGDACDLDDGFILVRFDDNDVVAWQVESGYLKWNLYRGSLSALVATGEYTQIPGSNPLASRQCQLASASVPDLVTPATGQVAYTLVTGLTDWGESGLGTDSAGVERLNRNPCP